MLSSSGVRLLQLDLATSLPVPCTWHLTMRDCVPVPQVTEQVPQLLAFHSYERHAAVLQICSEVGFALRQAASFEVGPRPSEQYTFLCCDPPPQVAEHELQPSATHTALTALAVQTVGFATFGLVVPAEVVLAVEPAEVGAG